ncbi:MAG: response regulator transcription factor [Anaerolineales bacterium]|nr:response regulator transcription factor [Anaerolineales bacterium]
MSDAAPIRIIIVDDHAVVRAGINFFLSTINDIELVGEANSGETAITLCDQLQPDIVLMDMIMPGQGGIVATRTICERHPHIHVIALTSFADNDLVQSVLQAGATSYLMKDVPPHELAAAIRDSYAGRATLASEAAEALIRQVVQNKKPQANTDLTEREMAVLTLMVEGLSNKQIAQQINLSPNTIRTHVSSILAKLEATNRTEAVRLAIQYNLFPQ